MNSFVTLQNKHCVYATKPDVSDFPSFLFSYDFIYVHGELSGVTEISPWWGKKNHILETARRWALNCTWTQILETELPDKRQCWQKRRQVWQDNQVTDVNNWYLML